MPQSTDFPQAIESLLQQLAEKINAGDEIKDNDDDNNNDNDNSQVPLNEIERKEEGIHSEGEEEEDEGEPVKATTPSIFTHKL